MRYWYDILLYMHLEVLGLLMLSQNLQTNPIVRKTKYGLIEVASFTTNQCNHEYKAMI